MKLFLIGTLLFSGGSAAAMQNETVKENVTEMYQNVRQRVQKRVKENVYENLKETGFPYPSEERLANLTEDQQTAILTAIDQINATYDFSTMTDDEIKEALLVIEEELNLLADELGLDISDNWMKNQFRKRVNKRTQEVIKEHLLDNLQENGIEYPSEERLANLTEEQQTAILSKIDELNATYDWASMTEEEIMDAMIVVKEALKDLAEELDFPAPVNRRQRGRNQQEVEEVVPEGSEEV